MTSKRFKKKMKDFRQGMCAWRVWGHTLYNDVRCDWVFDKEKMERDYGKGNYKVFFVGRTRVLVYISRINTIPIVTSYGYRNWSGGKRIHHYVSDKLTRHVRYTCGSIGDRFFPTKEQAQKFLIELEDDLHPNQMHEMINYHNELDIIDNLFHDELEHDNYPVYQD